MTKKIIFVGGGVATVFSCIKLIDGGYDGSHITVIEKGKSSKTRKSTEIMNGFFGAGSFSDFKNCYSLHQGGLLSKYTGETHGLELMDDMKAIIRRFHPDPSKIVTVTEMEEPDYIKDSPFTLRQSEIEHLGTDYGQAMGKAIEKWLVKNKINFLFETEVLDIDFNRNMLLIDGNEEVPYNELIIATGKSGMDMMSSLIDEYDLPTEPKAAQIGIRFETDYKYFKILAKEFYDFKLYQRKENLSIRTFCVNNERAYVAIEDTYGMKSFNGHAFKSGKKNNLINFGILMEVRDIKKPLEFTKDLVKRCNVGGKGKYFTFGEREPTVDADRVDRHHFKKLFGKYALHIFDFIKLLDKIFKFGDDYVFYLPEIKYLTNEIEVNKHNLSLYKWPNVHLAGDVLSARGIVVSACHGMYIAEDLLNNNI